MSEVQPVAPCAHRVLVDRHFALRLGAQGERRLRAHLPSCADCRARYERHLLLARLTGGAPVAEERIARGLGLRGAGHPLLGRPALLVSAAAAMLALIGLLVWPQLWPARAPRGIAPRGAPGANAAVELQVFRISAAGRHTLVEDAIEADDELALAYVNGARKRRLLVFGTDSRCKVYWYYPAWLDPGADPAAVPIEAGPGLHELPEAVAHPIRGDRLTLHAIFLDRATSVRQVEAALAARGCDTALELPGSIQRRIELRVRPPRAPRRDLR